MTRLFMTGSEVTAAARGTVKGGGMDALGSADTLMLFYEVDGISYSLMTGVFKDEDRIYSASDLKTGKLIGFVDRRGYRPLEAVAGDLLFNSLEMGFGLKSYQSKIMLEGADGKTYGLLIDNQDDIMFAGILKTPAAFAGPQISFNDPNIDLLFYVVNQTTYYAVKNGVIGVRSGQIQAFVDQNGRATMLSPSDISLRQTQIHRQNYMADNVVVGDEVREMRYQFSGGFTQLTDSVRNDVVNFMVQSGMIRQAGNWLMEKGRFVGIAAGNWDLGSFSMVAYILTLGAGPPRLPPPQDVSLGVSNIFARPSRIVINL